MAKKKKSLELQKEELIFNLDTAIKLIEKEFIAKFLLKVTKWGNKIKNGSSVTSLGKSEVASIAAITKEYYKKLGKTAITETNNELKKLAPNKKIVSVPEKNFIDFSYLAKEKAIEKVKAYQKIVLNNLNKIPFESKKNKENIIAAVDKSFRLYKARHIVTPARTESIDIVNRQRIEVFKKSRIVQGVQFLAVIDKRTTEICKQRNGMILKLTDKLLSSFLPALHYNCRSYLSPVTIYEKNIRFTSNDDLKNVPAPLFEKDIRIKKLLVPRKNDSNLIQPSVKTKKYDSTGLIKEVKEPLKTKVLTPRVLEQEIRKYEKDILSSTENRFERLVAMDNKGNVLLDKDGKRYQVTGDGRKIKGAKLLTHNHPSSSSFSLPDIITANNLEIEQIRAIAPNNAEFGNVVFYLNNAGDHKLKEVVKKYIEFREETFDKYVELVNQGKISNIEANNIHSHEIWLMIKDFYAKKGILFDYGYKKVD